MIDDWSRCQNTARSSALFIKPETVRQHTSCGHDAVLFIVVVSFSF